MSVARAARHARSARCSSGGSRAAARSPGRRSPARRSPSRRCATSSGPAPRGRVIGPATARPGLCTDGYTAFCCEIEHGRNICPAGTYVAGWWKCTDYRGGGLCHAEGVRYYLDCNRTPGHAFPGGCQCASGDCDRRRVDCNHFRYGQCNTQIHGTTEVVCRLVICQNPATVAGHELQRHRDGRRQHLLARGRLPGGAGRPAARAEGALDGRARLGRDGAAGAAARARGRPAAQPRRAPAPARSDAGSARRPRRRRASPAALAGARDRGAADGRRPRSPASTPGGDAVALDFAGRAAPPTLLAFLTSGCSTCAGFWEALGEPRLPAGVQTVIVTHGSERERPARLRALAPDGVPVVMSSQAWEDYAVPGRAVLRARRRRRSAARAWPPPGRRWPRSCRDAIEDEREAADGTDGAAARRDRRDARRGAGSGPMHPSLYPGRRRGP